MRLLHVSDIHFGAHDEGALAAVARFISENKPDALVVAGDITQNGSRREFRQAEAWLESLGVPCLVAPGNHDTPALHHAHRLHMRFMSPFKFYDQYLARFDAVGRLVELGGGTVRLTAINTARGVQRRLNWADGTISRDDLERALDLLAGGPPACWRLLICHHPLREPGHSRISVDTRRGGEALQRCAVHHVDAILTGHIHDAFAHAIHTPQRHLVQMGSGTLSTRMRGSPPSFCIISLEGDRISQDIVHVGPRMDIHRNYDSTLHQAGDLRLHPTVKWAAG